VSPRTFLTSHELPVNDLARIDADGSPPWLAVWPTAQDNPRHAGLELWMAVHRHQIVDKPARWFGACEHQAG
jgi:hypothetical protein